MWTLIGVVLAGLVAFVVDARSGRRDPASGQELRDVRDDVHDLQDELHDVRDELRTELRTGFGDVREEMRDLRVELRDELRTGLRELHRIAETQAEMNGQLAVLRALAHTHDAA